MFVDLLVCDFVCWCVRIFRKFSAIVVYFIWPKRWKEKSDFYFRNKQTVKVILWLLFNLRFWCSFAMLDIHPDEYNVCCWIVYIDRCVAIGHLCINSENGRLYFPHNSSEPKLKNVKAQPDQWKTMVLRSLQLIIF